MSYIGHLCTACGHPEIWRNGSHEQHYRCEGNAGTCGCNCRTSLGRPQVRPTFGLDGLPVERIVKPGDPLAGGLKTCGCTGCKTLHKELAGS